MQMFARLEETSRRRRQLPSLFEERIARESEREFGLGQLLPLLPASRCHVMLPLATATSADAAAASITHCSGVCDIEIALSSGGGGSSGQQERDSDSSDA